ncbi:hypothetical protein ScPMuIL_016791 [Solemya velum]
MEINSVVVMHEKAQDIRKILERGGLWDPSRRMSRQERRNEIAIPVKPRCKAVVDTEIEDLLRTSPDPAIKNLLFRTAQTVLPPSKKSKVQQRTPYNLMVGRVGSLLADEGFDVDLLCEVPRHWEVHRDLVLLPADSFLSPKWSHVAGLWETVVKCLKCQRLGRKLPIKCNDFRSSQVQFLYGSSADGFVEHIDNGIFYSYNVTKCMFSTGNITEKLRISKFDCRGEVVVDMYAGIGYFTLPYLVHARASHVHACEWNPEAVSALERNLKLNGVSDRCTIHRGDNMHVCPRGVADLVNLGLIPSSERGWRTACLALKDTGGVLHIHANVSSYSTLADTNADSGRDVKHCERKIHHGEKEHKCFVFESNIDQTVALFENCSFGVNCIMDIPENSHHPTTGGGKGVGNSCDPTMSGGTGGGNCRDTITGGGTGGGNCLDPITSGGTGAGNCCDPTTGGGTGGGNCRDPITGGRKGVGNSCDPTMSGGTGGGNCRDTITGGGTGGGNCHDPIPGGGTGGGNSCDLTTGGGPGGGNRSDHITGGGTGGGNCSDPNTSGGTAGGNSCDYLTGGGSNCCGRPKGSFKYNHWMKWASETAGKISKLLTEAHGTAWTTDILHIEHVKSYAPHIDHIVLDLHCVRSSTCHSGVTT